MTSIEFWNDALWSEAKRNLRPGQRFYLGSSKHVLYRIATQRGVQFESADEAESAFNACCLELFRKARSRLRLKSKALAPRSAGSSSYALCLATQQVLAVEMMVDDDSASSDSFFVRYSQLLRLQTEIKACPIPYADFSGIWETLKKELIALPESSPEIITFATGSGKNKYRALPLSQALLDLDALNLIHAQLKNIHALDDFRLMARARQIRRLSERAKQKLFRDSIRKELLEQIRSFEAVAQKVTEPSLIKRPDSSIYAKDFKIFNEQDGFDEFFRLVYAPPSQGSQVPSTTEALASFFKEHHFLELDLGTTADFEGVELSKSGVPQAPFALCSRSTATAILSHYERFEDLLDLPGYYFLKRIDERAADDENIDSENTKKKPQFFGGIALDPNRKYFLAGFPPSGISVDDSVLSPDRRIEVNDEPRILGEFLLSLNFQQNDESFRVKIEETTLSFSICQAPADQRDGATEEFGYALDGRWLDPLPTSENVFFRHLAFRDSKHGQELFPGGMEDPLLKSLLIPSEKWSQATEREIEVVIDALSARNLSEVPLASFGAAKIRSIRRLPSSLKRKASHL